MKGGLNVRKTGGVCEVLGGRGHTFLNKTVGRDVALAEFSNPNGMFVQDELDIYVFEHHGGHACAWS